MVFSTVRQRLIKPLLFWVTGLGLWSISILPIQATELLRWAAGSQADQDKAVLIYADQITTWQDQRHRIFLLKGKVWIGQGLVNIRLDQGVLWVDQRGKEETGRYHLLLYAEGDVAAEDGTRSEKGNLALLELTTSDSVKLKPARGQVAQTAQPQDPLFRRAFQVIQKELQSASQSQPSANESPKVVPAIPGSAKAGSTEPPPSSGGIQPAAAQVPAQQQPIPPPVSPVPPPQSAMPVPNNVLPAPRATLDLSGVGSEKPFSIRPRSSLQGFQYSTFTRNGETAVVVTPGIILTVYNADGHGGILDIEADRLVFWTQGSPHQILEDLQSSRSQKHRNLEFYMSGNVEIRTQSRTDFRLLRADEVYYDVNRHVAIANNADLEVNDPRLINPIHMRASQILQLNQNLFQAAQANVSASALPWDPGFSISVNDATLETKPIVRRTIFGRDIIDRQTGQPVTDIQRYFRGRNVYVLLEDFPVFYLPFLQGDAEDPLGPLENLSFNYNRIFGFQVYTTWDVYDLIGVTAIPGTEWRLNLDVLTDRGPAAGSDFTFTGNVLFDIPSRYTGLLKAYGLYDGGEDIIGGSRGEFVRISNDPVTFLPVTHPDWRGRLLGRLNWLDMPYGFSVQTQLSAISDRNFLEQYFLQEWLNDLNQETFLYVKQQQDNWAWTGLVEPRIRRWITETEWLPRLDGYLIGMSFFDRITYNAKGSMAYAQLQTTDEPSFAYGPTNVNTSTGRFDLWQDISVPFPLGPVKVAPYGIVDLSYYTNDLNDNDQGRFYGAGGLRASMPLSRLYRESSSELFNVDGIYHKVVFSGNFYNAWTNVSHLDLPQLDRLNDDASDQALRDIFLWQPVFNPANATALTMSPLFDPQEYAIRRTILNRIDTRDDVQVVQLGVRQRWQTKRGFPGRQHIIDWMTLNLSGSMFPRSDRDNFGELFAFLEYDWTWFIGDRTSLVSNGWIDPIEGGPRVFNLGSSLSRPDGTNFYFGYRQIDPLQSKAFIGSVSYLFSKKYSVTASASYDFGVDNQVTSLLLTRTGKDLRISMGVSYNSILNNFGVIFEIVPNLLPNSIRGPGTAGLLSTGLAGR